MMIYCVECQDKVDAKLISGDIAYPHRPDLADIPFWQCHECNNFVGCHYKTKNRTRPLGCIPNKELKNARRHIHLILDPIWQHGLMARKSLYAKISDQLGWKYHTAKIRNIKEARQVYKIILNLKKELG